MFAIVVVVANLMFILFFIFAFLLSKYPIQIMRLWLEIPPDFLNNAHEKAEEYIMTRHGINRESKDILEDEEFSCDVNKRKEEEELTQYTLSTKK